MQFCGNCSNMLYTKLGSEVGNNLMYYCRQCGFEQSIEGKTLCVSKTTYKRTDERINTSLNEYTPLDPTLPRINNVKCPSLDCESRKEGNNSEIIFSRYDNEQMRFIYMCTKCNFIWKSSLQ